MSCRSNKGFTQVEPLITPDVLVERYLIGVDLKSPDGSEVSSKVLQSYINSAVSMLEHYLDIAIMPRCEPEEKDYYVNDYMDWGYFQVNHYPVLSVESIQVVYTRDALGEINDIEPDQVALDIPKSWVRLDKDSGIIRLIPNNRFPSTLQIDTAGAFFPELFRRNGHVPNLWLIKYTHGFAEGKIPVIFNTAIGLIASLFALTNAGNFILGLGAGIASGSISLDGLSQSISTTKSSESTGLSAIRKEYHDQLYGKDERDPSSILKILRDFYRGQNINIV